MTSRSGHAQAEEGTLFWKLTTPTNPQRDRTLLLVHAGIADHSLWDAQVAYFVAAGWTCLVSDMMGFGASRPAAAWLARAPRPPVDASGHLAAVMAAALPADAQRAVVVGVSMGGYAALEFALAAPERVRGLVVVAGGVRGFDCAVPDAEMHLFAWMDALTAAGDVEGMAQWLARFWGHGPNRPFDPAAGAWAHANPQLRDRLLAWNRDLCQREVRNEGGLVFELAPPPAPPLDQLPHIAVPVAVALGTYDETATSTTMRMLASRVPGATLTEFPAAHLPMAELPDEFNKWLEAYLDTHFKV